MFKKLCLYSAFLLVNCASVWAQSSNLWESEDGSGFEIGVGFLPTTQKAGFVSVRFDDRDANIADTVLTGQNVRTKMLNPAYKLGFQLLVGARTYIYSDFWGQMSAFVDRKNRQGANYGSQMEFGVRHFIPVGNFAALMVGLQTGYGTMGYGAGLFTPKNKDYVNVAGKQIGGGLVLADLRTHNWLAGVDIGMYFNPKNKDNPLSFFIKAGYQQVIQRNFKLRFAGGTPSNSNTIGGGSESLKLGADGLSVQVDGEELTEINFDRKLPFNASGLRAEAGIIIRFGF